MGIDGVRLGSWYILVSIYSKVAPIYIERGVWSGECGLTIDQTGLD